MVAKQTTTKKAPAKTKKASATKSKTTTRKNMGKKCEPCAGQGFALFLIVIGFWWLAEELGWFSFGISIWPIVLIFFGVYHLIHSDH